LETLNELWAVKSAVIMEFATFSSSVPICGAVHALRAFRYTLTDFYMYPAAPIKFWYNLIHVKDMSDTNISDGIAIRDICTKNSICTSQ
jgi:hypothetical protein